MNIGKLDRLLTLQAPATVAQNEYGETVPDQWVTVRQVYAQLEYPQGAEVTDAAQLTAVQPIRLKMRYATDVQPTWRAVLDGAIYPFTAVAEIPRRAGLLISAIRRGSIPVTLPLPAGGFPYTFPFALS